MAIAAALVAPSRADAFVGESLVVDGAGGLTKGAETVLRQGKVLPELVAKSASSGGLQEATGVTRVLQSAKVLPVLGAVTAFGVGTVIGSEICHRIGIEGCWYFGSDGADPVVSGGSWVLVEPGDGGVVPEFYYRWQFDSPGNQSRAFKDCFAHPAGTTRLFYYGDFETVCAGEQVLTEFYIAARSPLANRTLDYHGSDDPEIENWGGSAPEDWPERLAGELEGQEDNAAARLGQGIAAEIPESGVQDPYAAFVNVPDCDGLAWSTCKSLIEEAGLQPQREAEDWQGADIEKSAGAVLDLHPDTGSELEVESQVAVVTNPDEGGMPLVVPQPEPGDEYSDYIERLAPSWVPTPHELPLELIDPAVGPDEVSRTDPGLGERGDPNTEPSIDVYVNPGNAPEPSGGSWTAPSIPAVDVTPLTGLSIGCNSFPFGLFCWLADGLGGWSEGSGQCPYVAVPIYNSQLEYDFCDFETAMEIIRPVLVVLSAFGVAWLLAAAALGIGGGEADE